MSFHNVVGIERYTTSTTNMYDKYRCHVPGTADGFVLRLEHKNGGRSVQRSLKEKSTPEKKYTLNQSICALNRAKVLGQKKQKNKHLREARLDGILFATAGTTGFGKSVRFGLEADGFVGQERHSGSQDNLFHGGRGGHVAGLHRRIQCQSVL